MIILMSRLARIGATAGDTTAPTSPTITATASSDTANSIALTAAATDAVGVTGYELDWSPNGSSSWTNLGGVTVAGSFPYSHTGLTASTTYYYRCRARDAAGNWGSYGTSNATTNASGTFNFYISPTGSDSNNGTSTSTPWAITALNSKRATYAGQTVGLMDGTYDIHTMTAYNGGTSPKLGIAPGTTGNPTIIKAVNPRLAIIDNTGTSNALAAIGQSETTAGYCTLKDVVVKGCTQHSILFKYESNSSSNQGVELVVDGCEVKQQLFATIDITIGIFIQGFDVATVTNNYLHDIHNSSQESACSGIEMYGCRGNIIEFNTFTDVYTGIYDKYAAGGVDMQGTEIRYNYFLGTTIALLGFDNRGQTGVPPSAGPYTSYKIHHNVFEECPQILTNPGSFSAYAPVEWYNNTVYNNSASLSGPALHAQAAGCYPSYYNNITYHTTSYSTWRATTVSLNAGAAACIALDYNCYGPSTVTLQTNGILGQPYTNGGADYVLRTFTQWKTATGGDSHAIVNDPSFTMSGSNAARFQLGGSSPCLNVGHVGGVSGGATRHMGAWDGVVSQIGKSW